MKVFLSIFALFFTIQSFAQQKQKTDSIYYLLDTSKTGHDNKMWEIHEESPSITFYTIKCSCLQYSTNPQFVFIPSQNIETPLNKLKFSSIKIASYRKLLIKAKLIVNNETKRKDYSFFIIEADGNNYRMRNVRLLKLSKPRGPSIDFEIITDSAKLKN